MFKLLVAAFVMLAIPRFADAQQRPVRGTFRFAEYTDNGSAFVGMRPIRYVPVTIKRGGTTIGTATTGHDGYFSRYIDVAQLPVGQTITVEFKADNYAGKVYLDTDLENHDIKYTQNRTVTPGTGEIYFSRDIGFADVSHHFSILDALTYARQYADARRDDTDDVQHVEAEYPEDSDSSYYTVQWDEITLQGPEVPGYSYGGSNIDDGWRDHTVIHEFGHHIEYTISELQSGGSHRACATPGHSYWFAWKEGFASFYAAAVIAAYPILQPFEVEETPPEVCPPQSENTTRQILWDLHDAANESNDLVNGARVLSSGKDLRRIIFEIFDNEQENDIPLYPPLLVPTTILSFHDAWVARGLYYGSHVGLDRVLHGFGITPHALADVYPISLTTTAPSVPAGTTLTATTRATQSGYMYSDEPLHAKYSLFSFATGYIQLATIQRMPFTPVLFNTNLAVPASTPPGTYWLVVEIDHANRIVESNENNNSLTTIVDIEFPLPPPIDF